MSKFPPAPTYSDPVVVDEKTGKARFNPIWLEWFLKVTQIFNTIGTEGSGIEHNSLSGIQGGDPTDRYHLNASQFNSVNNAITSSNIGFGLAFVSNFLSVGLGNAAPLIASASTISPTTSIIQVTGTATISTITPPGGISGQCGQITMIPLGAWSTSTGGNIALASTSIVNRALIMTWNVGTALWYPSY